MTTNKLSKIQWKSGFLLPMVTIMTTLAPPVAIAEENREVAMADSVRMLLREILDENRWEAMRSALMSGEDPWGSLGPAPDGNPTPLSVKPPAKTVDLAIPDNAEGSGTPDDPYRNLIQSFLDAFTFPAHDITPSPSTHRAQRGEAPLGVYDSGEIDAYLKTLAYAPLTIRIPAGHYRESSIGRPDGIAVHLPPGIWLRGKGTVVIEPEVETATRNILIAQHPRSGLVNLTLDGSRTDDFVPGPNAPFEGPMPETRVTAVRASHESVIADCHIRGFTDMGINRAGGHSWGVMVCNNVIEHIGFSGISAGSKWLIRDNRIRQAGLYRTGRHNDGDDGIIVRWGEMAHIVNNLIVQKRAPGGRHLFSAQTSDFCLYAGNIGISEGDTRNIFGLADASRYNRVIHNVALCTGGEYATRDPLVKNFIAFLVNGSGGGNQVSHNFSVGTPWAWCAINNRPGSPINILSHNYGEYIIAPFHHRYSKRYELTDNTFAFSGGWHGYQHFETPLPSVMPLALEVEAFGLFKPASETDQRVFP